MQGLGKLFNSPSARGIEPGTLPLRGERHDHLATSVPQRHHKILKIFCVPTGHLPSLYNTVQAILYWPQHKVNLTPLEEHENVGCRQCIVCRCVQVVDWCTFCNTVKRMWMDVGRVESR